MSDYCPMCGSPSNGVCSMCAGDPYYGQDGYYFEWLNENEEQAKQEQPPEVEE